MRGVLRLPQIDPDIFWSIQRGREAEERHSGKPITLNERPDQETIEIIILSPALAFGVAEFDEKHFTGRVAGNLNNIVLLEATEGGVQIGSETSWGEDKFTAEELRRSTKAKHISRESTYL